MQTKSQMRFKTIKSKDRWFPSAMTMPTAILLAVMSLFPLLFTLYYSFTDYYYLSKDGAQWSGLANFIRLVKDAYFRQAVWNTVKFTVICTIVETSLGLAIAIFVHGMRRGKKAMRTLLLLPYLLPSVTVALIWQIMLSGNYGIINGLLKTLGLPVFNWFFDVKTAFGTIVFIDIWQSTPFVFLLMYATLQGVPESQYEAARLDGAGKWKQFLHITLPSIKGGLFICLLLRTIDTFRLFEKVNILTKGGPSNTTATITQYLYLNGIRSLKFGFGSAMAVVMTVLVFALSALYIRKALSSEK